MRSTRESRTASAPSAPAQVAATLYRAKTCGRRSVATSSATYACSAGRNTLTSPAEGLSVPSTATTSNGQNHVKVMKPRPVAAMSALAATSSVRSWYRCAVRPNVSVRAAEPSSVPVTIAADLERREAECVEVLREEHAHEAVGETADPPAREDPADCSGGDHDRALTMRLREVSSGTGRGRGRGRRASVARARR